MTKEYGWLEKKVDDFFATFENAGWPRCIYLINIGLPQYSKVLDNLVP